MIAWIRRMFCAHAWRRPLPLVVLGTGEPLTNAKWYCPKCAALSQKETSHDD